MDAPQLPNPPDTFISQIAAGITFTLSVIGFVSAAVFRFLHKRSQAHPDDVRRSDTIELIDSSSIRNDLHLIAAGIKALEVKQDTILDYLLRLENENEIAKRAREEVARQLAQETRWHHRPE